MKAEEQNKEFARRASEPMYWHNKADNLHASAGTLWASYTPEIKKAISEFLNFGTGYDLNASTYPVYIMLCGLSLELALKSVISFNGKVEESHKLHELGSMAGIEFNTEQIGLMKIYSEYVLWAGKYPVPKRSNYLGEMNRLIQRFASTEIKLPKSKLKVYKGKPIFNWDNYSELYKKITIKFWDLYENRMPQPEFDKAK